MALRPRLALAAAGALAALLAGCGGGDGGQGFAGTVVQKRPNILLIVADDLGYSDIGAFGGEIRTPHLDALAAEGQVLTDYHTAATCSPTRSMLFSGTDHHLAGLGSMAEALAPNQVGQPGYEGYLNDRSLSIAQLLRDGGYRTYMAGKWHLGLDAAHSPKVRGFESSFALLEGFSDHFAAVPAKPQPSSLGTFREGDAVVPKPADFYSTRTFTDKLLAYLDQPRDGQPFFAYAAYTAPHWPLQAPEDYIDRYKGRYDAGYEPIRAARIAKQKQLGILPAAFEPSPSLPSTQGNPRWADLSDTQKQEEARRMEIYAAMVENLDHHIGRLIQKLKDTGEYDNTLIFFMSDNGAEGGTGGIGRPTQHVDNRLENLGRPLSYVAYGKRWAEVSATPFRLWKGNPTEGGTSAPAIVRLPKALAARSGGRLDGLAHVTDLAPTFLELAGVANPGARYRGGDVHPITGVSLLPTIRGGAATAHAPGSVLVDELFGGRYVRQDGWKLVHVPPPEGPGRWELFDLTKDRAEAKDQSAARPDLVSELSAQWDAYVKRVGVILAGPKP
ncbi:MAG: arylsulfatase [Comamonas sp.]